MVGKFGPRSLNQTSRSDSVYGNGRNKTAFTTLKIAVFAPMPSASVSTATAAKPGFFRSWRKANFRSFIPQRHHRIDLARAPGREPEGEQPHEPEQQRSGEIRCEVVRFDLEQQPGHQLRDPKRAPESEYDAQSDEPAALAQHQPEHVARLCAERHADAN